MILIRILEHPKTELESLVVDGDPKYQPTEIAQECASTGEGSRNETSHQADVASQCDEQEGACGETSCDGPLEASVNFRPVAPAEDSSVLDNLEGSSMQSLQDTSNIALNMFAKLAVSPMRGNSRIQYWQGRGSSRVELFASENGSNLARNHYLKDYQVFHRLFSGNPVEEQEGGTRRSSVPAGSLASTRRIVWSCASVAAQSTSSTESSPSFLRR